MTAPPRRFGAHLVALALAATACTGSSGSTTVPSTATTTPDPPPTSTTLAGSTTMPTPPAGPLRLAYRTPPGTVVAYDHDVSYRIDAGGDIEPEGLTVAVRGRRTFSWFAGVVETALDARRVDVSGTVGVEERDADGTGRDALQEAAHDPTLYELPTVITVDDDGLPTGGSTPLPPGLIDPLGLAAALDAALPPALPAGEVEIGDGWDVPPAALPLLGPDLAAKLAGTARLASVESGDDGFVAVVEAELRLEPVAADFSALAAAVLDLGAAERRLAGVDARLDIGLLEADAAAGAEAGRIEILSGELAGTYRIDIDRGIVVAAQWEAALTARVTFVDRSGEFEGTYAIGVSASSELEAVPAAPPPLGHDPDDLALEAFPEEIPGFAFEDVPDESGESVLNAIGLLLDEFPGVGGVRAVRSSDDAAVDVLAFLPASGARGDPGLLEAVATVAGGPVAAVDDAIEVDGAPVTRLEVDGGNWLVWQSNTRLLIAVGAEDAAVEVMETLIPWNRAEYLWQPGDCLDFGAGPTFDPPFSPFGDEALVPCYRPHTLEVVASTSLDAAPGAAFPDDMSARSDRFCGPAFLEFSGALAIETVLAELRYLPDGDEWGEGDRYLACTISDVDDAGRVIFTTASLRGTGPHRPLDLTAGVCRDGSLSSATVDCSAPHLLEAIGTVALSGPGEEPFPGHDVVRDRADALCAELLQSYADVTEVDGVELEAFVVIVDAHLWDEGVRDLPCLARASDADGNIQRVAGTFHADWVPLGSGDGLSA